MKDILDGCRGTLIGWALGDAIGTYWESTTDNVKQDILNQLCHDDMIQCAKPKILNISSISQSYLSSCKEMVDVCVKSRSKKFDADKVIHTLEEASNRFGIVKNHAIGIIDLFQSVLPVAMLYATNSNITNMRNLLQVVDSVSSVYYGNIEERILAMSFVLLAISKIQNECLNPPFYIEPNIKRDLQNDVVFDLGIVFPEQKPIISSISQKLIEAAEIGQLSFNEADFAEYCEDHTPIGMFAWSLYCIGRYPLDFCKALGCAIQYKNHPTSAAAIVGALVGATIGYGKIPKELSSMLNQNGLLLSSVDDIYKLGREYYYYEEPSLNEWYEERDHDEDP